MTVFRYRFWGAWVNRAEWLLFAVAALCVFVNTISLALARDSTIVPGHLAGFGAWLVASVVSLGIIAWCRPERDPVLSPVILLLLGWGVVVQNRLAPGFYLRHLAWVLLGTGVFTAAAVFPKNLNNLRYYRYTWLTLGLLLLLATFVFGVNPSGAGPQLWLPLPIPGGIYFQPSELLKLLLLIFLASYFEAVEPAPTLHPSPGSLGQALPFLGPLLLMWGFCVLLLILQRDLGAASLFFLVFLTLLYVATGSRLYLLGGAALTIVAAFVGYRLFDVVQLRIESWWNPWPDAAGSAYQIVQSLYAVSAGGVIGQGVYQGYPEYVPVVHSDFVFAAVGEEWGLLGTIALLALFAIVIYRGLRAAILAERAFHRYLVTGVVVAFGVQVLLITGGVTKLIPLTGVTLPFLSYGGSSLMVSCLMAGLLVFLSSQSREPGRL